MTTAADIRLRLRDDFTYYAANALQIRTKGAKIAPLVLNAAQERFLEAIERQWEQTGMVRIVVLKGRQMGLSTIIGAWLYWRTSQHKAQKTFVVAHKAESTASLFEMTKRYHDLCPPILKPSTKYMGKKDLTFDILQSSYMVQTAGGDGIGRAETLTGVHASEVGFWPAGGAKENWNGLTKAVPNLPGTAIFVESTGNGVTGVYYDLWRGAVNGSNGFIPVFLPWFIMPEYRDPVPEGFQKTPEEMDLVEKFGLDDAQLCFRRREIAGTSRDKFRQEYPCFAEEAFLTTGMPVFSPDTLAEMERSQARSADTLYALEGPVWVPNARGRLLEFLPHDPKQTYYIGADVAMGVRGGDYSVAQVLDGDKRQVALFRDHVHPDYFAVILDALGRRYNDARLVVESNNHGILPNSKLAGELAYPNLFLRESIDKLSLEVREIPGFDTNVKTKPLIIDELRAAVRDREVTLFDRTTFDEMRTFIVTETGRLEADAGQHDDCVMALALAHHIHEGKFTPIVVPDSAYFGMI